MVRRRARGDRRTQGVPHACGDGPQSQDGLTGSTTSSPRLWGWSVLRGGAAAPGAEFPTPVGMVRAAPAIRLAPTRVPTPVGMVRGHSPQRAPNGRVPHACGDGPRAFPSAGTERPSSPRLWGWSDHGNRTGGHRMEFPTPVGMVRCSVTRRICGERVPHACGDGPTNAAANP